MSAFVSLTLTPMMCANLLRAEKAEERRTHGNSIERPEDYLTRFRNLYERSCDGCCSTSASCSIVAVVTLVATILLYVIVPKGLLPQQDTGVIIGVTDAARTFRSKR